ncbi:hypothetical protein [Mucilaginibacter myungsuensis]|uniref:DUF5640 domain-containing protein n=1 Tax=Mucilaginibacter myungsuensis TaxID=649104 RepID=A0A929KXE6_9SPHI|nr:hypothetical protein [Mucilaginibacter myungsuensis]MBE9663401.1 hypothetical protein [Mucilaginibacter myungsuensis]MDN3600138.1 hypothetical protein [Mucilaginibacter myungsuensis]
MKTLALILVHLAGAVMLFAGSCSHAGNSPIKGKWKSKDGSTNLQITHNKFIEAGNDGHDPSTEDYFMKGDTIFTSFEGNQPYTKFVVEKVDEHNLTLLYPDSVSVEFIR